MRLNAGLETDHDGDSLYANLQQLSAEFPDSPSGFVAQQISHVVNGTTIPDADRAEQLLKQGRSILEGPEEEEEDVEARHRLWQQLSTYDDGTIVVIDTEDDQ